MANFNPSEHLMKIGDKDYLQVMWRLVWFRLDNPEGTIETEMLMLDLDRECSEETTVWNPELRRKERVMKTAPGLAMFRATVKDGKGGVAMGTKMEKAVSFPDFVEKSETGAIGRALAGLGYGTQFTGDELTEGTRIVDSPADVHQGNTSVAPAPQATQSTNSDRINASQIRSIKNLCNLLKREPAPEIETMSAQNAKETIMTLNKQWQEKQGGKKPVGV